MNGLETLGGSANGANQHPHFRRPLFGCLLALAAALASPPAAALDGCLVLLCLAAPSWRAIPQCVPPIRELLHDLARGRPFPTCAMAGAGTAARTERAQAPTNCPPQYTTVEEGRNRPIYRCSYTGAITLDVDGTRWSRTWWSFSGDAVTEFSDQAKSRIGSWDTRFDDDYAAWAAAQLPPCTGDC